MSIADSDKQYEELLELYDETDDKTVKKEILNRINAQSTEQNNTMSLLYQNKI